MRATLAALALLLGCDVYNQELIDGAQGDAGTSGFGATGGTLTIGGTGGSSGANGGLPTGGASGVSGTAGVGSGGAPGGRGGDGQGGDGDTSSGGTSGSGRGGSSMSGSGGSSGSSGSAGQGGTLGGSGGAGNAGGSGGNAGAGNGGAGTGGAGNSGGAGAAGAGSGGAGTGGAGNGGAGTGGSSGEVCTGCARLSVPLAASGDKAHFTVTLPAVTDLSTATIAVRVARYAGSGGWFKTYIQEGSPNYLYQDSAQTTIASIGTSMQTISWDVATAGTTANKAMIRRIGIEVSGAGASSWTSPTVLYVDSITITGTTLAMSSFPFDTSSSVLTTPTSDGPSGVLWLNSYSGDTNVTGAALSWLGP